MTELAIQSTPVPVPLPQVAVSVRPGTAEDIPFMDALQKQHTRQVGWMPTKQFEGKIAAGHVLVAVAGGQWPVASESGLATSHKPLATTPVGYLIGNDQYFKRDDVGIIYQINVAPVAQRGLIGATLLKAQFERSAWGCKLYCCWCAQDIAASHFWKAMGFVPLAFRAGSAKKDRVHIFWQKRIRAGDEETPWWFPSKTDGGAMREDRIVLPIPHGVNWFDEMPRVLPSEEETERRRDEAKALPARRGSRASQIENRKLPAVRLSRSFGPPTDEPPAPVVAPPQEKPKRVSKPKVKADPRMISAARELRDRWLEAVNRGEFVALPEAKYEVAREIEAPKTPTLPSPLRARASEPRAGVPGEGSKIAMLPAA